MSPFESILFGLGLGIASALHCAAMCGVFALRAASATSSLAAFCRFASYLGGKTFTYAFIGALAGYIGARVVTDSTEWRAWLGIGAASLMILAGVLSFFPRRSASIAARFFGPALQPLVRGMGRVSSGFPLGALTGLLPCGVVYLAAAQGAAAGSVLHSILLMIAFGFGTMPALITVGLLGRAGGLGGTRGAGALGLRLAGGVLLVAMGVVAFWRALSPLLAEPGAAPCCH